MCQSAKQISIFVAIFVILSFFPIIGTSEAFAQNVDDNTTIENSEIENLGYMIKLPQSRELLEFPEAIVKIAGDWALITPKEGFEPQVKELLDVSGVSYFHNRQVILPPNSNVMYRSQFIENGDLDSEGRLISETSGFDGTHFFEPEWPYQMVGTRSVSHMNPVYSQSKPKVCVVDSAVDVNRNEYVQKVSSLSYNFFNRNPSPHSTSMAEGSHGTATASLVLKSLGPNASMVEYIHLVALSDFFGGSEFDLASSIYYGADIGCNVFSMSLGFNSSEFNSPIIDNAFEYAKKKGSVFVIAAGNNGTFSSYPANVHADIIVGAVNRGGERPSWSNFPKNDDELRRFVSAPGVNINLDIPWAAFSGYDIGSGTSFSAPLVTSLVLNHMIMTESSAQDAVLKVLESSRINALDQTKFEDLIPYATFSNQIPKVSRVKIEPGFVINPTEITVSAIVEHNSSPPILKNFEFGELFDQVEMTPLGNNLYYATINVTNKFQSRYKAFWIEASNNFGTYTSKSPEIYVEGNVTKPGLLRVSNTNPSLGDTVEISFEYEGYYDFLWLGIAGYNSLSDWYTLRPGENFTLQIECNENYRIFGFQSVGPTFISLEMVEITVSNLPPSCPSEMGYSIGSNWQIRENQSTVVYAPGAITASQISWTITTPIQAYNIDGSYTLDITKEVSGLNIGDSVTVEAFIRDVYGVIYPIDKQFLVVVPSVYRVWLPLVAN